LRFEVLPAQTNGVERERSFTNVHLDCIISNRKRINKLPTFPPPWKLSADGPWIPWCWSNSWVVKRGAAWFNSFKSLKTYNFKLVCFLNLNTKRSNQKAQFLRVVNSQKTQRTTRGVFWYSSARPRAFAHFTQRSVRLYPCPFIRKATGADVLYRKNIVSNIHVLSGSHWQEFIAAIRAPRNFRTVFYNFWYSVFEVCIVAEKKLALLVTIIFVFYKLHFP